MSRSVNESDQVEAVQGRTLDAIERDVASVVEELSALRAEHDGLPAQVEAATTQRDAWRLEELERRSRALGAQIDEVQVRLCRLYAERAGLLLPEAEEKARAAKLVYDRAHAEYLRAHRLTNQLGVEADNAQQEALNLRQSVIENERRARELTFGLAKRLA